MDIMRPDLAHQVAPAPWLVRRSQIDISQLIRAAVAQNPNATTDQIAHQLAQWTGEVMRE
jgi:hypothetical protein